MKTERREGHRERKVLAAMITSRQVISRIAPKWDGELFRASWCNTVGGWCVAHFKKYGHPPNKQVLGLFEAWAEKSRDKDTVKLAEEFLSELSEEYIRGRDKTSPQVILDQAEELFTRNRAQRAAESIQEDIADGKISDALKRFESFRKVEIGPTSVIDVWEDEELYRTAFSQERLESLVKYPGDLGRFIDDTFARSKFVAFMAPEKTGKSFWLIDLACTAAEQRLKTVFFGIGDMTKEELAQRFAARAVGRPYKPQEYKIPKSFSVDDDGRYDIVHEEKKCDKWMTADEAGAAAAKVYKEKIKSKVPRLKLCCHANFTATMDTIQSTVEDLIRQDWVPDVVVLDYIDLIVGTDNKAMDFRHQVNETWMRARGMSQKYDCLFVTATQADAASYNQTTLGMGNFSNDKRINAHASSIIGLMRSQEEKDDGVYRLNYVVGRTSIHTRTLYAAGCLAVCRPWMKTSF